MLGKLAPGDVVTVTRIDRLARSTFDLFAIVKRIWTPRLNSVREPTRGTTPALSTARPMTRSDDAAARRSRDAGCPVRGAAGNDARPATRGRAPSVWPGRKRRPASRLSYDRSISTMRRATRAV
jgi:hypothetical protein